MPGGRTATFPRRVSVLAAVFSLAAVAVVGLTACGGSGSTARPRGAPNQEISRPDLGFSLELPAAWVEDVDRTPGVVFFAHAAPPRSWVRVFRGESQQALEDNVGNVVAELGQQGAQDFSQQPVQVGDLSGIRLDYVAADGPSGALASHSSYRVKKGDAVFSLVVATTDSADDAVLAGIASSFRVL